MKAPIVIKSLFDDMADFLVLHQASVNLIRERDQGRKAMDDAKHESSDRFNRYYDHNNENLVRIHNGPLISRVAESVFPEPVKPSYSFLSVYGSEGICPLHVDRPQCKYTLDVLVDYVFDPEIEDDRPNAQKEKWPININGKDILLGEPNMAVAYSGTMHPHYRNRIPKGYRTYSLVFFHFVAADFEGTLD